MQKGKVHIVLEENIHVFVVMLKAKPVNKSTTKMSKHK